MIVMKTKKIIIKIYPIKSAINGSLLKVLTLLYFVLNKAIIKVFFHKIIKVISAKK